MNIEIFLAVFFALVAYRIASPVIDLLNPFSFLTRSKGSASGRPKESGVSDYWTENAARLKAALATRGIKQDASDKVIIENAGDWFASLGDKTKAAIIATMRSQ